jgi:drug/metabolite transporter (DMT)-like permease
MALRDFGLLVLMCFCWALNVVVSRTVIADWGVPPLFYAALRFTAVLLLTFAWLKPAPRPTWRIVLVGLSMGAANFALLNIGLQTATASSAAVVSQLGVPITTLLSVLMLGERIRWRRGIGIILAFVGAMMVIVDPAGFEVSAGLLYVLGCAAVASLGAVMIKQMDAVKPLTFQAWIALVSAPPLLLATATAETGQVEAALSAGWPFAAALGFSVLVVSLFAHTAFYHLIGKYEANLLSPLTLMAPLMSIAMGVAFAGESFGLRMALGTAIALGGVLMIAVRANGAAPQAALIRSDVQG